MTDSYDTFVPEFGQRVLPELLLGSELDRNYCQSPFTGIHGDQCMIAGSRRPEKATTVVCSIDTPLFIFPLTSFCL